MKLGKPGAAALGLIGAAALAFGARALQNETNTSETAALSPDLDQGNSSEPAPTPGKHSAPPPPLATSDTPMAERIAVLGVLNKRDGVSRDISLHPGQGVRLGNLIVRLRACDQTADWEPEQLTGAFVQADLQGADGQWRRIFSGWLYKESPSLNTVENPLYDVWPKSCTMRHAETGPDTVNAASLPSPRSIAKKSAGADAADNAADETEPSPSALSNSTT
ncbi:hypothetical protein FHS31_000120 [Sphingomonas vulcanisoli]|uniref:DUF2155 domain-containing protein n=1 Tax=Sphingomonas vulcanisoli TaxID=1658060 RepID=A0ABX0TLY6_9SPHN|nr:hypothetical protein [Sphingomonas vulcanisoli]